jgi:hypothetical protein
MDEISGMAVFGPVMCWKWYLILSNWDVTLCVTWLMITHPQRCFTWTVAPCHQRFYNWEFVNYVGACGSVVGWGTMLQAWRSWVRFPMRSLGFSVDLILPATIWPRGSTKPVTEMSTRNLLGVKDGWRVRLATSPLLTDCLENVGASMSHNPMGLHGLLNEWMNEWMYKGYAIIIQPLHCDLHRSIVVPLFSKASYGHSFISFLIQ